MPARTWPILGLVFGTLLILIVTFTIVATRKVQQLRESLWHLAVSSEAAHDQLDHIRTNIYISSLLLRDYLSDREENSSSFKEQILANQAATLRDFKRLEEIARVLDKARLRSLKAELEAYWSSIEPVFRWTSETNREFRRSFLEQNVIPRRQAVITLAKEIADLNTARLRAQRQEMESTLQSFNSSLSQLALVTLLLTGFVALASLWRISRLETRSRAEHRRTEEAEKAMRRLSQQLVKAQEEERRVLSRELHDELGQMLTSMKIRLRNARTDESCRAPAFDAVVKDCDAILERSIQCVRDLAMGLRPAILDDLGLGAALEWQAREFSRRYDIPVTLDVSEDIEKSLTDAERTSIFRIVQESLTNCARHARASSVRIALKSSDGMVMAVVEDDGRGIQIPAQRHAGFGLLGMQERARELGGTFSIHAKKTGGTAVVVQLPTPKPSTANAVEN